MIRWIICCTIRCNDLLHKLSFAHACGVRQQQVHGNNSNNYFVQQLQQQVVQQLQQRYRCDDAMDGFVKLFIQQTLQKFLQQSIVVMFVGGFQTVIGIIAIIFGIY